ncbi:putative protein N(5)-glutamine methyltransferase [Schumannella sp. 10F1B-5-1]|nr:putative protein N(5)-glutamine methyltransferase [Schumannella sp. 10F1B-5-1]
MLRLRGAGCVYAEDEAALIHAEFADADRREAIVVRRIAGEPLEHLLGWAEFRGLRVAVAPGVFVPRARSGVLVDAVATALRPGAIVVELCCGAGAVSAALAAEHPGASLQLHLGDLDAAAIACARRTLAGVGVDPSRARVGDLFGAVPAALRGRIDVVVANAPYVPTAEIALMPSEARDHEAPIALDGGGDGLDLHRRILSEAPSWLAPHGIVVLETSPRQAPTDLALMHAVGLVGRVVRDDDVEGTAVIGESSGAPTIAPS